MKVKYKWTYSWTFAGIGKPWVMDRREPTVGSEHTLQLGKLAICDLLIVN